MTELYLRLLSVSPSSLSRFKATWTDIAADGTYAPETHNVDSVFDVYNNIFNSIDFTNFGAEGSFTPTINAHDTSSERASSIPLERFALVARLWPNNKSRIRGKSAADLWTEVINFKGDNILTDTSISETSPAPSINRENEFQWGLDEDKRRDMILEFASDFSRHGDADVAARFPPLRLLNLGLDVVFRQAHSLLPFVHQPTFSAKSAPSSVVLPLCLLGLLLLDSKQARGLALSYLPVSTGYLSAGHPLVDCCRASLRNAASSWGSSRPAVETGSSLSPGSCRGRS